MTVPTTSTQPAYGWFILTIYRSILLLSQIFFIFISTDCIWRFPTTSSQTHRDSVLGHQISNDFIQIHIWVKSMFLRKKHIYSFRVCANTRKRITVNYSPKPFYFFVQTCLTVVNQLYDIQLSSLPGFEIVGTNYCKHFACAKNASHKTSNRAMYGKKMQCVPKKCTPTLQKG